MNHLLNGCTFTELALAYLPHDTPNAACRTLRYWLVAHPTLKHQLKRCGFDVYAGKGPKKRFTPLQIKLIFKALGEP